MLAKYPKAPRVATGEAITSTHFAKLARAFNARKRLGIGNPGWRDAVYSLALARQVRNPDSSGFLYPAETEWHEFYSHVTEPTGNWPVAGPGEAEGANIANPLMAYVFGAEALNLYDEATRMTDPFYGGLNIEVPDGPEPEAVRIWNLRKQQAGGWDPVTGATASPAFTVARSYAVIRSSRYSSHGNAYGGFLAGPGKVVPACAAISSGGPVPINLAITFTALRDGVTYSGACGTYALGGYLCDGTTETVGVLTYPGTCPQTENCAAPGDPECYPLHVVGIVYSPWSYYVICNADGPGLYVVEELPTSDWMEGPYCGAPRLSRTHGSVLERVFWEFVRGWRGAENDQVQPAIGGSPPSGDPPTEWLSAAFDVQRFMTEQYALAPAAGTTSGNECVVLYPEFRLGPGTHPSQSALRLTNGGAVHTVAEGCVVHGAMVWGRGVSNSVAVQLFDTTTYKVRATLPLTVGESAATGWFALPSEWIGAGKGVGVKVTGLVNVAEGGSISVQIAESMAYRPQIWDLFMVLRLMGAKPA